MRPSLSTANIADLGEEGGGGGMSGEIVDGHITISQAGSHHLGVGRVTVQTHDSTVGVENILRVGGVLQGVETDVATLGLGVEIVRPIADSCRGGSEESNYDILFTQLTSSAPAALSLLI